MTEESVHFVRVVLSQWYPDEDTARKASHELAYLTAFLEDSYPELDKEKVASAALAVLAVMHVVRSPPKTDVPHEQL